MNNIEQKYYLSPEKKSELENELIFLRSTKRKEIAEQLEYSKALGDLSENAEYHQAREDQAKLEDRIMMVEHMLKHVVLVKERHSDTVGIGSSLTVRRNKDKETISYSIVGSEEADSAEGKISNVSPLGKALLGKKKGDKVEINTPKGSVVYIIENIN